jgi:hypothetical protein
MHNSERWQRRWRWREKEDQASQGLINMMICIDIADGARFSLLHERPKHLLPYVLPKPCSVAGRTSAVWNPCPSLSRRLSRSKLAHGGRLSRKDAVAKTLFSRCRMSVEIVIHSSLGLDLRRRAS